MQMIVRRDRNGLLIEVPDPRDPCYRHELDKHSWRYLATAANMAGVAAYHRRIAAECAADARDALAAARIARQIVRAQPPVLGHGDVHLLLNDAHRALAGYRNHALAARSAERAAAALAREAA